ncbi:hypothetical protein AV545_03665 [Paenibacillus jamilae]|uniref:hypothetical protein n=1 Tax=Paenibacillus jamilae TaxID=114136 RepID=UPI0007ABB683|nr:hypothetical protein [Paenibacillus jamilae]KZE65029.1 hypothetical protein AV545_03665 [Paenibacillus jamilae]
MNEMKFFKIKQGTKYHEAVKQHLALLPKWKPIYAKVSELLDEKITLMVQSPNYLQIEYSELKKDENKKIFKKDGTLKTNSKKAKEIEAAYKEIVKEAGLEKFESLGHINFCYCVMRYHGETLKTFKTSDHELYYKADFDLEERTKQSTGDSFVIPITEIEHQEKYLEEIKKQSA